MKKRIAALSPKICLLFCFFSASHIYGTSPSISSSSQITSESLSETTKTLIAIKDILSNYRKIIILLSDEKKLSSKEKEACDRVGLGLFHENLSRTQKVQDSLETLISSNNPSRFSIMEMLLNYIESDENLYDADRLAFKDILNTMQQAIAKDQTLPAIKLHKRLSEDQEALLIIEKTYEKEIDSIFSRFTSRSIHLKRERWEHYISYIQQIYPREQILKEHGIIPPNTVDTIKKSKKKKSAEIFGYELPPHTIVLTFDDGPHRTYTNEISAILKQYNAPAIFFEVGQNIGTIQENGKEKLSPNSSISRKLLSEGYLLANHSFSHALLSKETGTALNQEINKTDILLKAISPNRSPLFRFPYGAQNKEGLDILAKLGLYSIKWNIDSKDWADPIPSSIANRVLQTLSKEKRGIILFHDIHERTVKALPMILDHLSREGYQFAQWKGNSFKVISNNTSSPIPAESAPIKPFYNNSWAVIIGIDHYDKWPNLQYAVHDATSVQEMLLHRFNFPKDHILLLTDKEATRSNILALFHDKLSEKNITRDDRILVFFAGHGATTKLSSGRNLGYIIPSDSNPERFATDAIPMTEIQNIAENLVAKHAIFIMDACYSGLGLTRGGSSPFLRENSKRIARQMLTAGGADQLVADGGPNGHSIFTWTLLQALDGKADFNGDGLITGTELAAFIAPAVSSVSQQTPAFGSLPGSEGGEFILELPSTTEFINEQTHQLSSDAIALNTQIDKSRLNKGTQQPIVLKTLQGGEQKIITPPSSTETSPQQLAQNANDQGLLLYREKHYTQAESFFINALKYKPDFALAANNLGFVYFKQKKYTEAILWFKNTIAIDPSRAIAYLNMGDAYISINDMTNAKIAYKAYLELAPNTSNTTRIQEQLNQLSSPSSNNIKQ